jgi:Putative DNA-binding domain
LHNTAAHPICLKCDYGDLIISQGLQSLADTKATLTSIVEKEQLSLPNLPAVRLLAFLHQGSSHYFWRSDARNYPVHFPFFDYHFAVDQSCKALPPSSAVWAHHLPLYPSGRVAIEDLLHTRLGDDRSYEGVLAALAPDYRGKISGIRVLNSGISVQIVCPQGQDISILAAKLYCEDSQGSRVMKDLEFDDSRTAFLPTTGFPRRLVVVLFSKISHELIDERVFDSDIPFRPADLTIEEVEQNVENLIAGGESDSVEFKSQIPQKQEAIAITAVAFANQKGGRIFIGVENDGQIIGYSVPNAKEALTNILRDRCEPSLEFEIQQITVLGKAVLMITIMDGKDKPYQVKEKGFYLRMQGTNRLVTRYELDEMYRLKSGNFGFGVPSFPEY